MAAAKALIIRTAGTNCDVELARAFTMAGAAAETVHLDALSAAPEQLRSFDLIGFPGGFSYGDDVASGRIKAAYVRERLLGELVVARDRGVGIIGVCNGFQVLVQLGLLPGFSGGGASGEACVALCENAQGRFVDDWARVDVNPNTACVWTRRLAGFDDGLRVLPYAHGEGRLVCADAETTRRITVGNLDALRTGEDINGSVDRITGLCDGTGRVFGLMPHPERVLEWNRHPWFTRLTDEQKRGETPGLSIFTSAVEAVTAQGVG